MIGVPTIQVVSFSGDVTLVTTTETVLATLSGVSTRFAGELVKLAGLFALTTGVGTTFVTIRVRRGTAITGTLAGEAAVITVPAAAGSTDQYSIAVEDTPGAVASQQYVLTAEQGTATGNGTAVSGQLLSILGG